MVDKLIKMGNITQLEKKILDRLYRVKLIFGNSIQLAEINILKAIDDLKFNEEYFKKCEGCQDIFSITDLTEINEILYCQDCIGNDFIICETCGDYVYYEDINVLNEIGYCEACYFKARQVEYKNHIIVNPLLWELSYNLTYDNFSIYDLEFKIAGDLYSIETYAGENFRLGSWSANNWVDIGNCADDLLKAIDYNLGNTRDKLTAIFLKDKEINLIKGGVK